MDHQTAVPGDVGRSRLERCPFAESACRQATIPTLVIGALELTDPRNADAFPHHACDMKFRLITLVVFLPAIAAATVVSALHWYRLNYEVVHARLDYDVYYKYDQKVSAWHDDWKDYLVQYELVGGCGCCVATYEVQGPRRAIDQHPKHTSLKITWLSE